MRTVIALGGNAIASDGDVTVAQQRARIGALADAVGELAERGDELLFTHGNGPQVGQLLLQQSRADAPERPLDVLVAETQAQIGYLVADQLESAVDGRVTTVVTRVRVDPADPAFEDPTKPIGPYYTESEAAEQSFETGPVTKPTGESAYRRLVPSPEPTAVLEIDEIRGLVADGVTVVCGGGGGVPVVGEGACEGVEAVVDKDHTTRLVASAVDADCLVMATHVEYAYRNFGTDDEEPIRETDAASLRRALEAGEFAAGSMRPKVAACLRFLDAGGDRAVITTPDSIAAAVDGDAGTQIRP
ncbi:amino acid kinase family protein [Halorubrum sp. FL23]|uniref:amino acid kinase family protein n=1 Tax=Halorubrum sp. FL23 TaxID=3458704 RepID=UPI0040336213